MAGLLIDVGNTSWKATLVNGAEAISSCCRFAQPDLQERLAAMQKHFVEKPDWVAVSSVAAAASVTALRRCYELQEKRPFYVAKVENHFDGFALPYADVSKLGVDRWLAMLAVREFLQADQEALIADCGTAITVEHLSKSKMMGGVIAPGLGLMTKALNVDTADLPSVSASDVQGQHWGVSTETAIAAGCLNAALGLLERQQALAPQLCDCWITGGDAQQLLPHLPTWQWREFLVLQGLQLWWRQKYGN